MISIIVPCYNVKKYIDTTIKSILHQSYTDFECILIDDGSTDGTAEICKQYEAKDSRIKYLYQKNSGVSIARNRGLKEAKGDFIIFVDGDDSLETNALFIMLSHVDIDIDIVCFDYSTFGANDMEISSKFFAEEFVCYDYSDKKKLFLQLLDSNKGQPNNFMKITGIGVPWAKIYRREFIIENKIEFNSKLSRLQDNIFNMYCFAAAGCIKYVHENVYKYRIEHIGIHKMKDPEKNYSALIKARNEFFEKYPPIYALVSNTFKVEIFYYYLRILFQMNHISEIKNFISSSYVFEEVTKISIKNLPIKYKFLLIISKYKLINVLFIGLKLIKFLRPKVKS